MLNDVMLNDVMLSVIMLSVIVLNVMAPSSSAINTFCSTKLVQIKRLTNFLRLSYANYWDMTPFVGTTLAFNVGFVYFVDFLQS
jgi:hypothetical protein